MFVESNEFVVMLNGWVVFSGIIEAGDGDGNRKELGKGEGDIGRDTLGCRRDEETELRGMYIFF